VIHEAGAVIRGARDRNPFLGEDDMSKNILDSESCARALAIRDLSDESQGKHAMQLVVRSIISALVEAWHCQTIVHRASPIVSIQDNYDRLHYAHDGAARDARYTRYVSETTLLRTQTSAMIPPLLQSISSAPITDVLLACPGLVYRRDTIDRMHTGEPHQIDLWRLRRSDRLTTADLSRMIEAVVRAALPGYELRCLEARHPYTTDGLQIDVRVGALWVEIGECGLALPALLGESGIDSSCSGLAMGLGLDRLVMLRKGIDDIRLLRSTDPRVATQLLDLSPYRAVSKHPAIRRDLSVVTAEDDTPEELGDRVRDALGARASGVESVQVLSETAECDLPRHVAERLGIAQGQKNVLLRVVLRDLERTLTDAEANALRDRIYAALHRGTVHEWALGGPPSDNLGS
jgi:phenylalanyl-tRNA synthetase alpha chain